MDYPNGFNISSFPAGKTIAFSRSVSVWIAIVFFLILCACGFLLLGIHLKKNYPFLISVDPFTEEWSVITYPGKDTKEKIQQYQIVQEKLVNDFVKNWFTVYSDNELNEVRWQECAPEQCKDSEQFNPDNISCAIYCKSDEKVFDDFYKNVLPDYRASIVANSGTWTPKGILITPNTKEITETSGVWQVYTTVQSSLGQSFDVLVFIKINQDYTKYPATFGYYIKEFNAYRVVHE